MRSRQPFSLETLLEKVSSSALSNRTESDASATSILGGLSLTTLLESFVPGYGPIQRFLLLTIGVDVTILVTLAASVYVVQRLLLSIYKRSERFLSAYFKSEITVQSGDEIHLHLIAYLALKNEVASSRRLMAETTVKNLTTEQAETEHEPVADANGKIKWLNFADQEAKTQPRFTPAMGSHNFWHDGNYFMLQRKQQMIVQGTMSTLRDMETITIGCFGRSTKPIKDLIDHVRALYYKDINKKTVIRRPAGASNNVRSRGTKGGWMKVSERPCRPLETVVLDEAKKMEVLLDINEYLSPATAKWYSNRGIPWRRGYLLYGPPGTGKTSLTFSLAGVFGLEIYVVSLLDPTLTEEELGTLFSTLPARCIVLLEDIDTAGLIKRDIQPVTEIKTGDMEAGTAGKKMRPKGTGLDGETQNLNVEELARALKKASSVDDTKKSGITLSGLLNIIDGVASHEGRVLIMTTNKPEALDPALIRPGRVDHQVAFTNATQSQIKELFKRMYSSDTKSAVNGNLKTVTPTEKSTHMKPPPSHLKPLLVHDKVPEEEMTTEHLTDLACKFSEAIPDVVFSPAEIQGFLLKRKKEPRKAVEDVVEWVKEMLARKENGGFA